MGKSGLNPSGNTSVPERSSFIQWMGGRAEIVRACLVQTEKDLARSGVTFNASEHSTNDVKSILIDMASAIESASLCGTRFQQLYYIVDLPEETAEMVESGRGTDYKLLAELILYRAFTKVYFRMHFS